MIYFAHHTLEHTLSMNLGRIPLVIIVPMTGLILAVAWWRADR